MKITPIEKPKKQSVQHLRKKADKLLQELNRKNNKYCLVCGSPCTVGHHFYPKGSSSALRYVMENIIPLCASCHLKIHSCHGTPMIALITLKKGEGWLNHLEDNRYRITKASKGYYNGVIERLENEL